MRQSDTNLLLKQIYAAQLRLFGIKGQERLQRARVHIAGLGGIGFAIVGNLVAAGIGTIVANDPQAITIDNLNRLPFSGLEHVGISKAAHLRNVFPQRPESQIITHKNKNEEAPFGELCRKTDIIVCCSNSLESRLAAVREAIVHRKTLIDVSVADAKTALAGFIKLWLPCNAEWSACPACYFQNATEITRGESILPTVASGIAAFAANMVIQLIVGLPMPDRRLNFFAVDYSTYRVEALSVLRKQRCVICAPSSLPQVSSLPGSSASLKARARREH